MPETDVPHINILQQGIERWNRWRNENPQTTPQLAGKNLSRADLEGIDLSNCNLEGADLGHANLNDANLSSASLNQAILVHAHGADVAFQDSDLSHADFGGSVLFGANFSGATIKWANFVDASVKYSLFVNADLSNADFQRANLTGAKMTTAMLYRTNLENAILAKTDFTRASLMECEVFGVSGWGMSLEGAFERDLIIRSKSEPIITVDNLEMAQFIYLLANNKKLRGIIDTMTSKVVLILGSFQPGRKAVLNALRDALRVHDYLPVVFDFDKPDSRTMTETVSIVAHLARFVIADITDPKSVPHEIASFSPHLRSIPVQPIIAADQEPYTMIGDFDSILPIFCYSDQDHLLTSLYERVVSPAESLRVEILEQNSIRARKLK